MTAPLSPRMAAQPPADHPFLAEGGHLGALIRATPWAETALGSPGGWPENLRTLVRVMLASRQPMFVAWGPERIMLYNDGYAPLCGSKHPWALGKPFAEVWADIIDAIGPIMDAAYAGVPTYMDDIQFTMLRHGFPEETHFSFGYTPVRDDDSGAVVGMFCTCLEITADVRAGRERQAEVERLREMFLQAPGAVAVLRGPSHVFELANPAYLQLIGHREVIGKPITEALPEVVEQGFVALLDRVFSTGEPFVGHGVPVGLQRRPDAPIEERQLDFVYQPIRDAGGTVSGIFVEATDVTERARAEMLLRQTNERLEMALSAGSGVGTWDWDVAQDRVSADARFARLYGVDPALAAQGVPIAEFLGGIYSADRPRVEAKVAAAMRDGAPFASEYRLVQPDGSMRWVVAQGRCTLSPDGKPLRFPGVSFDITERKAAEEAVRRAKDERDFVAALTVEQRSLPSPDAVMRATAERVGKRLGVSRAGFYRMLDDETVEYGPGWSDGALPLRTGRLAVAALGSGYHRTLAAGRAFSFSDVQADPDVDSGTVGGRGTRSGLNVPFIRAGRWEAGLYLSSDAPREWSAGEIALFEEVAQLSWDAVERSRAEMVLRQSEEFNRRVLESSSDCIEVLSLDLHLESMSAGGMRVMELDDFALFQGRFWPDFWSGETREKSLAALDKARAGSEGRFQGSCPTAKGKPRWWDVVVTPVNGADGRPEKLLAISRDISANRRAEEALRESEERLRTQANELAAIYDAAPVGLTVLDTALRFVRINERLAEINGLAAADHIGRSVREVLPDLGEAAEAAMRRVLKGEALYGIEFTGTTPAQPGVVRTWRENWLPFRDAAGIVIGITISAEEITQEKAASEAQRRAKEERDFVIALGTALRSLDDPGTIMEQTAEAVARRLKLGRAGFYRISEPGTLDFGTGWGDGTLPVPTERTPLPDFGPAYGETLRAGKVFAFADSHADPRLPPGSASRRLGSRAGANVPLIRAGRWEGGFFVGHAEPRRWEPSEIALMEEVAELAWDAVEKADAARALRASEERYRTLFGAIDEGFCVIEFFDGPHGPLSDYRHVEANPAYAAHTGIPDVVGREVREMVPDEAEGWIELYRNVLLTGRTLRFERELVATGRFLELFAFRVEPESRRQVGVLFRDVTERRLDTMALRELNETLEGRVAERTAERNLLATILETTDAFVQAMGLDYRWLAVNKAAADEFEAIFGVCPRIGASALDLLADRPEHREAVKAAWERAFSGEEFTEVRELGDPRRARRFYERKFSSLRGRNGELIGAYQFSYDVTARLNAQARLAEAEAQVRQMQKMEAVGQLTGGIAHDFNNMMAVVIGGLNLLKRRLARGDTDVGRYVDGAMDGASRAAALTQRLLAFSRQQPLSPEAVDANQMVNGMLELLTRTLGENVRVETALAPGLWRAKADPGQLENAVLNLCVNGRDAMPDGGRLRLETANAELDEAAAAELRLAPGAYVVVAVSDTGHGMSQDVIDKAFDPFFTTKGVGKGTGLGLSQVFGFISQSGGQVKIDSEVDAGTTVRLVLPRFAGEDEAAAPRPKPASTQGGRPEETVLVVEDEERVRAFSVEALRELGYRVAEAGGAAEALALMESGQDVTLLFTDIVMPDMTGPQLADLARARRPGLKVLYTTGYARNAIPQNGMLDPGTNFLAKPFGIEQLAAKVRGAIDET